MTIGTGADSDTLGFLSLEFESRPRPDQRSRWSHWNLDEQAHTHQVDASTVACRFDMCFSIMYAAIRPNGGQLEAHGKIRGEEDSEPASV